MASYIIYGLVLVIMVLLVIMAGSSDTQTKRIGEQLSLILVFAGPVLIVLIVLMLIIRSFF